MLRTHTCGELRLEDQGKAVVLCAWVQRLRDKGSMLWIDLRDRYGITQLACEKGRTSAALFEKARHLGREDVLRVHGQVRPREAPNTALSTGSIEVLVQRLEVLAASALPPFLIEDDTDGAERLRMQYRYLDLRRPCLQAHLMFRHLVASHIRKYLDAAQFIEIETPHLIKSTPEGARDFLVPSRMHQGEFYALPQSPQTFKQLLMVSGFDRYYQLARCFRDEDLRADRQPEFTQLDIEMSFIEREDILQHFEGLIVHLFAELKGLHLSSFPRLRYAEAMARYGSDKPDLRLGMEIMDLETLGVSFRGHHFRLFDEAPTVRAFCANACAHYTRKQLDALTELVRQAGGQALVYAKVEQEAVRSSVDKFYDPSTLQQWAKALGAAPGDMLFLVPGEATRASEALGALRLELGRQLGLCKEDVFMPVWVHDFPLLEYDADRARFQSLHHPFTAPTPESIPCLAEAPEKAVAQSYDLVINGVEIAGGSLRITSSALQRQIFTLLGLSQTDIETQFGFLLQAFAYGVPPHGGIAMGFDRLCALMRGQASIREMIAFPKSTNGRDAMLGAPSVLSKEQQKEAGLRQVPEPPGA